MKKIQLLLILLSTFFMSNAQSSHRCNFTADVHEQRLELDPEYKKHVENHRNFVKDYIKSGEKSPTCSAGPIIIPVAVHFDGGIVPAGQEACAIAIAQEHLAVLNEEFAGLDTDAGTFSNFPCFGTTVGEACMEFCLATESHPTGYGLTNGQPAVTFGQINFNNTPPGSGVPIDANWAGYLNIFVDNLPCLLYTSPSPRDRTRSRMPSSA